MTTAAVGRPRSAEIDQKVLATARRHLAQHGYGGLSMSAVATEAGTTRPALYRRWPSKASLATAAIADMSTAAQRPPTDDPYRDLVEELSAFRAGITRPDGLGMIGTMLSADTESELVQLFRERIVDPRRTRFRSILQRGIGDGSLDPDADVETAVSTLTGSWYAYALAGAAPPKDWPQRIARHTWNALRA